jgi:P27 family predicted phage terminase small subunit
MSRLTRAAPAPRTLGPEAAKLWRHLIPLCVQVGSVRACDLPAFELLVVALATERQARARLDQDGLTVATAAGGVKSHPCLRIAERARAQALGLLGQFGLTPVALQQIPWDQRER